MYKDHLTWTTPPLDIFYPIIRRFELPDMLYLSDSFLVECISRTPSFNFL